jgi:hypothetical protein
MVQMSYISDKKQDWTNHPVAQSGAPVGAISQSKEYHELSSEIGFPVMETVDQQMLQLYEAMLKTFGSTFNVPVGLGACERTRRVVSEWGPQMYDSTLDAKTFGIHYAKSKFFKRWLSTREYEDSSKLEHLANRKYLETMLEGHRWEQSIKENEELKPLFNHMRHTIRLALGEFNLLSVYEKMKHGPNSTGTIPKSEAYPHVKDQDLTGTRSSLQQYWHYLRWNTIRREELVDNSDEHRRFINGLDFTACNVVDCNNTLQVPKEWNTLRTMNPEHTVPAQFAQGVAAMMEDALFRLGIDLSSQQEVHRNLAKLASQFEEIGIATIDWSEASNRIWLIICEEVFGEDWMRFIKACCRSPYTGINFKFKFRKDDKRDQAIESDYKLLLDDLLREQTVLGTDVVKYCVVEKQRGKWTSVEVTVEVLSPMVATMGNPITFPLQTLVFYAFLAACSDKAAFRIAQDPSQRGPSDMFISCFGDDGIVSVRAIPEVKYFASLIGWKYNDHKSFYTGRFREYCGGDYYRGVMVRPVMLKRPPKTSGVFETSKEQKLVLQAWSYIAANAVSDLVKRYDYNDVLIQDWLVGFHASFKLGSVCLVPPCYPDGSGLRVTLKNRFSFRDERFTLEDYEIPEIVDDMDDKMANNCHLPYFDIVKKEYSFRALLGNPSRLKIDNEVYYYQYRWLKFSDPCDALEFVSFGATLQPRYKVITSHESRGISTTELMPKERQQSLYYNKGFFDVSGLDLTQLDADGSLPVKELRLRKKVTTVPVWEWWLPTIYLK